MALRRGPHLLRPALGLPLPARLGLARLGRPRAALAARPGRAEGLEARAGGVGRRAGVLPAGVAVDARRRRHDGLLLARTGPVLLVLRPARHRIVAADRPAYWAAVDRHGAGGVDGPG